MTNSLEEFIVNFYKFWGKVPKPNIWGGGVLGYFTQILLFFHFYNFLDLTVYYILFF